MPLVPEYSWNETDKHLSIDVKATGLSKAKSDLLICDTFLCLNCAPYLLQLDLLHAIVDGDVTAIFGVGSLSLRLTKVTRICYEVCLANLGFETRAFTGSTRFVG